MAQCKWCGRSGFFLSVSAAGLCSSCHSGISLEVRRKNQIIQESIEIISKTKKFETAFSRYELIIELLESLVQYERKGITVNQRSQPSETLRELRVERDKVLFKGLEEEFHAALAKSKLAATASGKTTPLAKVALLIRDYSSKASDPYSLKVLGGQVLAALHQAQLQIHLEAAQKAELKGQKKKALEAYYEALYFLTHDEIPDSMQKGAIEQIKMKITELGGMATDLLSSAK